ncbi:MAG: TGS domain-containing protein [Betaproteobacteria bacterium]|nr:MAG: TGS domain-containing protein [Betaproteobacteria bacterium]
MPANLSPEYKAAEAAYRKAREPRERLDLLREMLRTIPKHKGTERLQADIKARIKELSDEIDISRRRGGHGGPALVIRPEGAAQIALIGPPNSGKSLLHARMTGSGAHDAPYPFTTQVPQPGMMPYEDIYFQLVDLPAVTSEHPTPWLQGALQSADAALLMIDITEPTCVEQLDDVHSTLRTRRVALSDRWEARSTAPDDSIDDGDPFAVRLPTLLLANKIDVVTDIDAELQALRELSGLRYPTLAVSATTGYGLGKLGAELFSRLRIVRVYTKTPGHASEKSHPFTLRSGETVRDVARLVHKDLSRSLRYARVWGHAGFDGQHVGPEHVLVDRDVIELHA